MDQIIYYSNASEIINSDIFLDNYNNFYKDEKQNEHIKFFLESIKKNKNYYKLNIDPLIKVSDKKINIETIKKIKNNINKLSEINKENIFNEIDCIVNSDKIAKILVDIIIDSSICNNKYIDLNIELIKNVNEKYDLDLNNKIDNFHNFLYKNIEYKTDDYELLCEINKSIDNSIGYSILLVNLENCELIVNKTNKLILELINLMDLENENNLYKYLQCIYNIYIHKKANNDETNQILIDKLEQIKNNIKNKKINFKIMDINDLIV